MNKLNAMLRSCLLLALVTGATLSFYPSVYASESPQSENRYEIITPLYLHGVYKRFSNQMAFGSLTAIEISGPEIAFQTKVPVGTIMTIVGPAPKIRDFLSFFFPSKTERYFVRLEPDPSRGLDVILELNRGIEGSQDGLNPEIFRRGENAPK